MNVLFLGGITWSVGMILTFEIVRLTIFGSKTGYHTFTSLKWRVTCLFIMLAVCILIAMLRRYDNKPWRSPVVEFFKFYSGLFVLVHVQIKQSDFRGHGLQVECWTRD